MINSSKEEKIHAIQNRISTTRSRDRETWVLLRVDCTIAVKDGGNEDEDASMGTTSSEKGKRGLRKKGNREKWDHKTKWNEERIDRTWPSTDWRRSASAPCPGSEPRMVVIVVSASRSPPRGQEEIGENESIKQERMGRNGVSLDSQICCCYYYYFCVFLHIHPYKITTLINKLLNIKTKLKRKIIYSFFWLFNHSDQFL